MVGRRTMGQADRQLCQIFPENADEILGGMPCLLFGDFGQLPPVGDLPLFSDKHSKSDHSVEGRRVFEAFTESVTLQTVFRQAGQDPEQVAFRDALLRQRTYEITEDDYQLLSKRFWSYIPAEEHTLFNNAPYLNILKHEQNS